MASLLGNGPELLGIKAGLLDDGPELVLRPSRAFPRLLFPCSQDIQRTVGPPHALGSRPSGTRAREDSSASPDAIAPVVAAGVGATVSATAAVSVVAAGAGATVSAAVAVSVVAAGAGATVSSTTAAPVTGSSSASSSRFITSLGGGTPGAASCPAGSAAGAKGGTGVGLCSVPDCGTLSPVAAAEAATAGGTAASPTTPPLAPGGVTVGPTEVVGTQSAFFGASGRTKFRGAAV
uniref:Uncharacterized protein n=1 Tax=Setaria viridis TaxID=4556 RepID=A0A4U6VJP8_SETVI|nr:hypothetical protein SEVIR_3G424300v2 [Setaria viridis]